MYEGTKKSQGDSNDLYELPHMSFMWIMCHIVNAGAAPVFQKIDLMFHGPDRRKWI